METRCSFATLGKLLYTRGLRALIKLKGKTKSDERAGEHREDMG